MKAVLFRAPGGLSNLKLTKFPDPGAPGPGEVRVRLHATSLNGHDYNVAVGRLPVSDGRVMMADGAGVVEAVGAGVPEFSIGGHVMSTFFPDWRSGVAPMAGFARSPGDGAWMDTAWRA